MSYTPTTWINGDTITAEKLNNMEQGIQQFFVVHGTISLDSQTVVFDETFPEMVAAVSAGAIIMAVVTFANGMIIRTFYMSDIVVLNGNIVNITCFNVGNDDGGIAATELSLSDGRITPLQAYVLEPV